LHQLFEKNTPYDHGPLLPANALLDPNTHFGFVELHNAITPEFNAICRSKRS
jgi:hypothetical protein